MTVPVEIYVDQAIGFARSVLGWFEANPILGAAFIGSAAYVVQRHLGNRDKAKAAVGISLCALDYVFGRFEAALEGKLSFRLRGARTTEMISAMQELEVTSLPHEIIDAFAHVRSDAFAVNVRISDVFDKYKARSREIRINSRRNDLISAARVINDAIVAFERLNRTVSRRYLTRPRKLQVPDKLSSFVTLVLASDSSLGED